MTEAFQVVWYKRDLRITDHEALFQASQLQLPTVFLYIHEPEVFESVHYSPRHERFIWESIEELKLHFSQKQLEFFSVEMSAVACFEKLISLGLKCVHSIEEVGLEVTFARDRELKSVFEKAQVEWKEYPYSGIRRGLNSRKDFNAYWYDFMSNRIPEISWEAFLTPLNIVSEVGKQVQFMTEKVKVAGIIQKGGISKAWLYLNSFTKERVSHYMQHISKPEQSRKSCSRMSPYLAWEILVCGKFFSINILRDKRLVISGI